MNKAALCNGEETFSTPSKGYSFTGERLDDSFAQPLMCFKVPWKSSGYGLVSPSDLPQIAATLASTGTAAFFHAATTLHGDLAGHERGCGPGRF